MERQRLLDTTSCMCLPTVMCRVTGSGDGTTYSDDWRVGAISPREDEVIRTRVCHHHCPAHETCAGEHLNVLEMWAAFCAAMTCSGTAQL